MVNRMLEVNQYNSFFITSQSVWAGCFFCWRSCSDLRRIRCLGKALFSSKEGPSLSTCKIEQEFNVFRICGLNEEVADLELYEVLKTDKKDWANDWNEYEDLLIIGKTLPTAGSFSNFWAELLIRIYIRRAFAFLDPIWSTFPSLIFHFFPCLQF